MNPDIIHPIDENQLNQRYYFQSLTEQAVFAGLLTDSDMARIKASLFEILSEQTNLLTKGKSSSIPAEKAQELLTSVVYTIGLRLKYFTSPEQAVDALKSVSLRKLFDEGLSEIRKSAVIARRIQKRISDKLFDTPNVYYRSTIIDGINGFFKLYKPQFSAQEIHITADYPVCCGRPQLDGIEFIGRYLRCIEAENEFLNLFEPSTVHKLLCSLSKDYRSCPINLFEPVLLSALALSALNRSAAGLDLTKDDINRLYELSAESCAWIADACSLLCRNSELSPRCEGYIKLCLPHLIEQTENAVKMHTLDKIFLAPVSAPNEKRIVISYGDRMDDKKYQKLTSLLLQSDSEDKIRLIMQEIHSLADLLDIMSDAELSEEEFNLLVNALPDDVFAALMCRYPDDDFLERESDQILYDALQNRFCTLNPSDSERIRQMQEAFENDIEF